MGNNGKKNIYRAIKDEVMSTSHLLGGLDKHIASGYYLVELNHTDTEALGLPIGACDNEHYLKAHLFVTENGTNNQLQKNRRVGQVIFLTGCNGDATDVYSRCGDISSTGCVWGGWARVVNAIDLQELRSKMPKEIVWGASSKIYSFTDEGVYTISGERLNDNDGLPIANAAPGHTVNGRLIVLDSSITGSGNGDDKCVTQILALSNRTGGDGDIYVRTGSASSKNILSGGGGWENWGKLQQNIAVGQVTSLNSYIENGVYSGVYTDGSSFFETFVMVVINNYAVAGATDCIRSISQFKYALDVNGTFSYKTRTGQGNTGIAWGDWVDLGAASTTDIQDNSITTAKLSGDVREKLNNPLRALFIAAGAEYNDTGVDKTKTAPWGENVTHKAGHYYLNGLGDITEGQMTAIYNMGKYWVSESAQGFGCESVRTNLPPKGYSLYFYKTFNLSQSFNSATIEVINLVTQNYLGSAQGEVKCSGLNFCTQGARNLKRVIGVIDAQSVGSQTNINGTGLEVIYIKKLKTSISIHNASMFKKESVLYVIQNAVPTSAITITLHPDAYARLAGDADVVAALEAQPLVSLVSA